MKGGQALMTVQSYHESAMWGMLGGIGLLLPRVTGSHTGICTVFLRKRGALVFGQVDCR